MSFPSPKAVVRWWYIPRVNWLVTCVICPLLPCQIAINYGGRWYVLLTDQYCYHFLLSSLRWWFICKTYLIFFRLVCPLWSNEILENFNEEILKLCSIKSSYNQRGIRRINWIMQANGVANLQEIFRYWKNLAKPSRGKYMPFIFFMGR